MSEFIMRILHTAFFGHDVHSKIAPIHLIFHYHQLMLELDTIGVESLPPVCAWLFQAHYIVYSMILRIMSIVAFLLTPCV